MHEIIYLNGSSSSGKTTLARALQKKLEVPFLVLGVDQIIYMMPEKMNDWNNETDAPGFSYHPAKDGNEQVVAYKIEVGPYGEKMIKLLKDVVITAAQLGNNIIVDDVSFGKKEVDEWRKVLNNFNVLWVGVTAPIKIIEQRERNRGDRKIGSAKWQTQRVHEGVVYDCMIDTYNDSLHDNVEFICNYEK
jgi:chloramphenicol 3-O phosphotransferase